jgi:hypothetical protein
MKRLVLVLTLGISLLPSAWGGKEHMPDPAGLPPAARRIIRERMEKHGSDMSTLLWAVLFLDYERTARLATSIAEQAQPLDRNAPELQSLVHLFEMQDQLRHRAATLAEAAADRSGVEMSAAFKQVTETCVNCHYLYLNPRATPK